MTKTVIGTYRDMTTASAVVNDLVNAGFHRNSISLIANDTDQRYASQVDQDVEMDDTAKGAGIGAAIGGLGGLLLGLGALAIPGIGPVIAAGPIAATLAGAGIGAVTGGIIGALVDLGIPEESAHVYAESVRRGNILVAAQVEDNRVDAATGIMEREGLIDIDRESEGWRSSGWSRFDDNDTYSGTAVDQRRTPVGTTQRSTFNDTRDRDNLDDDTIEVVEEEMQVGKRAVETGGVRVKSHVREVPVEEEVHLRQEHVEVERRPVNRPATTADLNAFREGTIEVRETQEEAVIAKDARVVEEIHVRKDVEDHTEKVHDTVRRTEVEVEQLGRNERAGNGMATAYEVYDPDFRTHFKSAYSGMGNFDRYQPAYQYGYTLATDNRYRGRNWRDVEPEARRAWDAQNQNSWEDFKDAVQYSWDKVRGRA
jgi:uncharacterized protein (TIGR02271 family)